MKNELKIITLDEAKSKDTSMRYETYTDINLAKIESSENFLVDDIIGICESIHFIPDKIINIFSIHVAKEDCGNNFGNMFWSKFLNDENVLNEKVIVVLRSAPLKIDYPEKPSDEVLDTELTNQATYIETHLAMRNIQSVCGFENSIPYIYPTTQITPVMEAIIHDEITCPKLYIGGGKSEGVVEKKDNKDKSVFIIFTRANDFDPRKDNYIYINNAHPNLVSLLMMDIFANFEKYDPLNKKVFRFFSDNIDLFHAADDFWSRFQDDSTCTCNIDWEISKIDVSKMFEFDFEKDDEDGQN